MKKGDIVLVPFPFTDLSGLKNRPCVVLIVGELDVTVAFITTQTKWQEESDIRLNPTITNGLKAISLVKLNKIATIDNDLVIGRLGELTQPEVIKLNKSLIELLQLK